jgi:hypothetical protein
MIERTEDLSYITGETRAPRLPEVDATFEDFLAVIARAEVARLDRARGLPGPAPTPPARKPAPIYR